MKWLAGFSLALLAACAQQAPAPKEQGHPTIVSLNPCTDAILVEVADPAQILALSHYSHDPGASSLPIAIARRFRATGGTAEEVLALDPDLVVAGSFLAPATVRALRQSGIRVETFDIASDIDESEAQVRRVASLAGHPARGAALVRQIHRTLAATKAAGERVSVLLWQEGGIVPGERTLIARLLAHTGFENHSAARGLGQGAYLPLERVVADPPDVILSAADERALTHPALSRLDGLHHERLEPSLLYCGGPTIIRTAQRLHSIRERLQ